MIKKKLPRKVQTFPKRESSVADLELSDKGSSISAGPQLAPNVMQLMLNRLLGKVESVFVWEQKPFLLCVLYRYLVSLQIL